MYITGTDTYLLNNSYIVPWNKYTTNIIITTDPPSTWSGGGTSSGETDEAGNVSADELGNAGHDELGN